MRQTFVLATDGTQPEYLVQTAKEASHDHPPQPLPPQQTQAMNEIPTPRRDACYARAGMMLAHQVDELDKECCKLEAELTSAAKELAIYRTVLGLEDGDSIPLDQTPQYGNFLVDHAGSRSRRTPMNDEAIRLERELAKTSMQLTSALAREAALTQERDVAISKGENITHQFGVSMMELHRMRGAISHCLVHHNEDGEGCLDMLRAALSSNPPSAPSTESIHPEEVPLSKCPCCHEHGIPPEHHFCLKCGASMQPDQMKLNLVAGLNEAKDPAPSDVVKDLIDLAFTTAWKAAFIRHSNAQAPSLDEALAAFKAGQEEKPVCRHPNPKPGPRIPLLYGSAATLICECGAWCQERDGEWRTDKIKDHLEPTEDE